MDGAGPKHIMVQGGKTGLPFSKGLMAASVLATGLEPGKAHFVAERIEAALRSTGRVEVTADELRQVAAETLEREVGPEAATRYRQWQSVQERTRPLLILVGGPTGAGKSTLATHLAQRLGITRIISTDTIREIMRTTTSPDLLPSLHVSSFEMGGPIALPSDSEGDLVIRGFLRQTQAVAVGIEHILQRAVDEGADTIVEGVHVVPGLIREPEDALVVQLLLCVDEEDRHRSHLSGRSQEQPYRPGQRYLDHFSEIRQIQNELLRRASEARVRVVSSYALDQSVAEVTRLVVDEVTRRQLMVEGERIPSPINRPRRGRASRRPT